MELTSLDRPRPTMSLGSDERPTHDDPAFNGEMLNAGCDWMEPHERFKADAEAFMSDALKLINQKILEQEAELMRWRRKRQEMLMHQQNLGLSPKARTY